MSKTTKGIICIICAAFFFSTMTVFVRLAGDLPTMQKTFFRNLIASFVSVPMFLKSGQTLKTVRSNLKDLILRSVFGTIGMFGNYYAIDHLNISDANMLNKLSPFFAIIMSFFLLNEKIRKKDIICVLIAFAGALFVIKPGFSLTALPAFIGVIGGFGAGTAYTYVRRVGMRGVKGPVIVMFFSVTSTLFTLPFFIASYQPMSAYSLICLLMVGICATGGQLSITAAYTFAPASEISIYDYTQVIFAAIWGIILFSQKPDILSIIGYAIIIGAAIIKQCFS